MEGVFYRTLEMVKADPMKYSIKDKLGKWKLSALMVSSLTDPPCSDVTARRVITRIEFETLNTDSEKKE